MTHQSGLEIVMWASCKQLDKPGAPTPKTKGRMGQGTDPAGTIRAGSHHGAPEVADTAKG